MAERLSHLDDQGRARMVDVGAKDDTERVAVARARVTMQPHTLALIQAGSAQKGDVLTVAQIAGIQAAKRAHELIPMCHPLLLTHVAVTVAPGPGSGAHENNSEAGDTESWVEIEATVRTTGKTGVEMEALTAASVAALTVYDMCKAADRGMRITDVRLVHKSGGKSGNWHTAE